MLLGFKRRFAPFVEVVDLRYIDALAHKNSEAVSFLPRPRLEQYAAAGQILMACENGEPCGYLIHGNGDRWCRIYQACVQYDARRREHGLELLRRLVTKAEGQGFDGLSLWCAEDVEANAFWRAAGFTWAGQRDGGARRGRKHNRWILWIRPLLLDVDASVAVTAPRSEPA